MKYLYYKFSVVEYVETGNIILHLDEEKQCSLMQKLYILSIANIAISLQLSYFSLPFLFS